MAEYWVVIPAYNEAATIRDVALRAIRQNENVIVVDDGSTDGTAEALVDLPVAVLRKSNELWKGRQPVACLSAGIGCRSLWRRDSGR